MPELPPVTSTLLPWSPRTRSSSVGRAIRISRCGRSHRYTRQGPCHTAPTMSDTVQPGPGNVTRIGGSVYGQVISGDNNLQYQVRVEEGGIVNLGPRVDPRALPLPVVLRPRDFPSLVGRERELDVALAAIAAGAPVEVQGAAKTGKTVLLRYLAHRELPPSVPDGVVYLEVDGVPPADVLQSLFEAFHETDGAYKPTELRIRRAFQRTRALLLLDDATFDERAITRLLNALPRCVVVPHLSAAALLRRRRGDRPGWPARRGGDGRRRAGAWPAADRGGAARGRRAVARGRRRSRVARPGRRPGRPGRLDLRGARRAAALGDAGRGAGRGGRRLAHGRAAAGRRAAGRGRRAARGAAPGRAHRHRRRRGGHGAAGEPPARDHPLAQLLAGDRAPPTPGHRDRRRRLAAPGRPRALHRPRRGQPAPSRPARRRPGRLPGAAPLGGGAGALGVGGPPRQGDRRRAGTDMPLGRLKE